MEDTLEGVYRGLAEKYGLQIEEATRLFEKWDEAARREQSEEM